MGGEEGRREKEGREKGEEVEEWEKKDEWKEMMVREEKEEGRKRGRGEGGNEHGRQGVKELREQRRNGSGGIEMKELKTLS